MPLLFGVEVGLKAFEEGLAHGGDFVLDLVLGLDDGGLCYALRGMLREFAVCPIQIHAEGNAELQIDGFSAP